MYTKREDADHPKRCGESTVSQNASDKNVPPLSSKNPFGLRLLTSICNTIFLIFSKVDKITKFCTECDSILVPRKA